MVDYIASLKKDLVEQFKGKENIEVLIDAFGKQLQDVYDFYEQLRNERDVYNAVGVQLDRVGDIVDMTRAEAGKLVGNPIPFDIIDDTTYRRYLIYKILKNTCECTYPDIIKAFRMFWDKPLYYSEDKDQPATMIFDTGEIQEAVDTTPLFQTPLIRAAGVTLKLFARTSVRMEESKIRLFSGFGFATTETILPIIEREYDFQSGLAVGGIHHSIAQDVLPTIERDYKFGFRLHLGANLQAITQDVLPELEREYLYRSEVNSGAMVQSVMETPIGDITNLNNT